MSEKTNNITLREIRDIDKGRILEILMDEKIRKTYMIPDFTSPEEALLLFKRLKDLSYKEDHFVKAISHNDEIVGWINDVEINDKEIELGYVIHSDHQNRGYMTSALKQAIALLFEKGYQKIICGYFISNIASKKVMEKAGMIPIDREDTIEYRNQTEICHYCEIAKRSDTI